MSEFFADPVPQDRVRVEATIGHETYRHEIPAASIDDEVFWFERNVGAGMTAERMEILRGTEQGSQFGSDSIKRAAAEGRGRGVICGVLWGIAHHPQGAGWSALENLGGRIVRARHVPERGWWLEIASPDGEVWS